MNAMRVTKATRLRAAKKTAAAQNEVPPVATFFATRKGYDSKRSSRRKNKMPPRMVPKIKRTTKKKKRADDGSRAHCLAIEQDVATHRASNIHTKTVWPRRSLSTKTPIKKKTIFGVVESELRCELERLKPKRAWKTSRIRAHCKQCPPEKRRSRQRNGLANRPLRSG